MTTPKTVKLEIEDPPCNLCNDAGFPTGSEYFDPHLLHLVRRLEARSDIHWRFHCHLHATHKEIRYYFIEVLMEMDPPFNGYARFDGVMNEDPERAVDETFAAIDRFNTVLSQE